MEHLYNPDRMTEQEIKRTFVARQHLVEDLTTQIERQPQGAGVQHFVIIAPRGMGKTTMLLMVGFAVRDRGLSADWQTVRFAEESYSITSLADFWLQVIHLLAEDTQDVSLRGQADALIKEFRKDDELQEATLALLKDWCRQNHKRLLLLVDNFDLILDQINDEQENARLRNVLMNDGMIMLIGGATTFFREARAYDQPLYNFFKIIHLDSLKFEEMQDLLRQRAALDDLPDFEATLRANRTRLKVLEYFTGGNPRLVLMLYRIITDSEVVDVRRGLEQLLDQVTPYYKGKLESLPPQQRKILDQIARVSGETHEGSTPTQIATATRLTPNAVSSQLKRLAEQGYVRSANLRGRSSYYTLAEPLYAIWHQMRFGRSARQKMQWLVSFLKGWYDTTELEGENKRLEGRFAELLQTGLMREARQVLEHRFYVVEAMDVAACNSNMNSVVSGFLALQAVDMLNAEVLPSLQLENLSADTLERLVQAGCIRREEAAEAVEKAVTSQKEKEDAEVAATFELGKKAYVSGHYQEALEHMNHVVALRPTNRPAQLVCGMALIEFNKLDEATIVANALEASHPSKADHHILQVVIYQATGRFEDALLSADLIISKTPEIDAAWQLHASVLANMGRYEEAMKSVDRAIEIDSNVSAFWHFRGQVLNQLERYEEAVESLDQAIRLDNNNTESLLLRGTVYRKQRKYEAALADLNVVVKREPRDLETRLERTTTLIGMNKLSDAVKEYNAVLKIADDTDFGGFRAIINIEKIPLYVMLRKLNPSVRAWQKALQEGKTTEDWHQAATNALLFVARTGNINLVHKMITMPGVPEAFLPLARAVEYVLTGDEEVIEKLSPEIRGIVDEMIQKIRPAQGASK